MRYKKISKERAGLTEKKGVMNRSKEEVVSKGKEVMIKIMSGEEGKFRGKERKKVTSKIMCKQRARFKEKERKSNGRKK